MAILGALIVIFGGIFSQVQRVLGRANDLIRIDRTAASLEKVIRRDISAISKGGFLKITNGEQIAFTAVGSHESMTDPELTGNSAIIDYGLLGDSSLLWRRLCVLTPGEPNEFYPSDYGQTGDPYSDRRRGTLRGGHYDGLLGDAAQAEDDNNDYVYIPEAAIQMPPAGSEHWADYLGANCTDFKVFWWDGANWSAEGATGSWSAADPNNWPKALRIEFNVWARLVRGTPTIVTGTTLIDMSRSWMPNAWANATVRITAGAGKGQVRNIVGNTSNMLMVDSAWAFPLPSPASTYVIAILGRPVEIIATLE